MVLGQEGWVWIRERPEDRKEEVGELWVRPRPGSIWGPDNAATNVAIKPLGSEEGVIEATVSCDMVKAYEQAGIMYYCDDDNYIKLVKELVGKELAVVLGREEHAEPQVVAKAEISAHSVELKLEASGGTVTGMYREEGGAWTTLGSCDGFVRSGAHGGLLIHGGATDKDNWVRYSDIRVTPGN